jgi:hypothetical protein
MDFYKNSGGGSPSFAIDNLSIINEATPLVNDTDYPKISNILSNDFDFLTKINKLAKHILYYCLQRVLNQVLLR